MERHERYDPEDIESLLAERSYDELLADERAFVLKHVSGRDEYERMRALLHYVRPDERERGTIEPEERVKRNVMAAFRAQQQPQWRIWLNTLAVWLAPKDAAAMWRPALAFGSLALLIVAGVVAVKQFDGATESAKVAEVKPVHSEKRSAETEVERSTPASPEEAPNGTEALVAVPQAAQVAESTDLAEVSPSPVSGSAYTEIAADAVKYAPVAEEDLAVIEAERLEERSLDRARTADSFSHVVTPEELSRNMSVTNATGAVAMDVASKAARREVKVSQQITASRSVAQEPRVLDLVTAGW